jgi:hypothetical protein
VDFYQIQECKNSAHLAAQLLTMGMIVTVILAKKTEKFLKNKVDRPETGCYNVFRLRRLEGVALQLRRHADCLNLNLFKSKQGDIMLEGTLNIEVIGSIKQRFEVIDSEFTAEDVINLVKNGEALTTIGHGEKPGYIVTIPELRIIAKVISQEAGDDLEIKWDSGYSVEEVGFWTE